MGASTINDADRPDSLRAHNLSDCMPCSIEKWRHYASQQKIEVALPPLFIATVKKERVLRLSEKESRDRAQKIRTRLVGIA